MHRIGQHRLEALGCGGADLIDRGLGAVLDPAVQRLSRRLSAVGRAGQDQAQHEGQESRTQDLAPSPPARSAPDPR
jgi:hypothetical protein